MAVIGYLGTSAEEAEKTGLIFEVSSETLETIKNMTWSGSARYATHQRHMTHALTEFVGLDPDKITFDITFLALSAPVIKCKKTPRKKCNYVAERREKDRLPIGRKKVRKGSRENERRSMDGYTKR